MVVFQNFTTYLVKGFLEIRVSRAVIVLVIKTGEGGIDVLERYVMFFTSYPGTKMDHSSLLKGKVYDRSSTQIADMGAGQ